MGNDYRPEESNCSVLWSEHNPVLFFQRGLWSLTKFHSLIFRLMYGLFCLRFHHQHRGTHDFYVQFLRMCYSIPIFPIISFYKINISAFSLGGKKETQNPLRAKQESHDALSPTKLRETENKELLDSTSNRWQYQYSSSIFSFSLFLTFCDISLPLGENPSVASSVYARTRDFTGWSWPGWKYCCSHSCSTWLSRMHTGRVIAIAETSKLQAQMTKEILWEI